MPVFQSGDKHPNWKGGRTITGCGYVQVFTSDTDPRWRGIGEYALEHRLVMERHLGRVLEPTELVHHKNHDRQDNRLCNLEIMSRGDHARHHNTGAIASEETKTLLRRIRSGTNGGKFHPQWNKSVTKEIIIKLRAGGKNMKQTAQAVGMSVDGLRNRMKHYGIFNNQRSK